MKYFTAVLLCAAMVWATPVTAQRGSAVFSGQELLTMCSSTYDTDYGYCAGFIGALINVMQDESVGGFRACNLRNIRAQQGIDIFKNYAMQFPETLPSEARVGVAGALARAFPCR